ncbi:MAG TPA: AAA family ATPase [Candidatus Xenobia bacterium]
MRIEQVEVIGFGPFEARTEVTFPAEGLSLVVGPNESGKSLLMKAIFGVIFGLSPEEIERYRGWYDPPEFEGRVRMVMDDRTMELVRYFDTQVAEIWEIAGDNRKCLFTGEAPPGGKDTTYFLELAKLVGFEDPEVATGTTFVTDRELETKVNDKLRRIITGSKRADYEKILQHLKAEFSKLTRWDPWTPGEGEGGDRDIERLEKELGRMREARHQVLESLRTSSRLQAEIKALMEQYQNLEGQVENEQRALEGLSVLEGLLREESGLRERCTEVRNDMVAVRNLQEQLTTSLDRVATEHAPLLHLQTTFLEEVQALTEARREVARVAQAGENEKAHRHELQGQLKRLTEDLQAHFGAFEDLPEDFPEKLSLFQARQRELATLSAELTAVETRIRQLENAIAERYTRFVEQEDDYDEQLRDLDDREGQWRSQLLDLDAERARRHQADRALVKVQQRMETEFLPFQEVAEDFSVRLRAWHDIWQELTERQQQMAATQRDLEEIRRELEGQHRHLLKAPPSYETALKAWRTIHHRFESERPRLDRELDTVLRLQEEQEEASRMLSTRYGHLAGRVYADTGEKLREHRRLSDELAGKERVLGEARERLKVAEEAILSRYGQFLDRPSDWGERLEQHRKTVESTEVVFGRLRKEEEQWQELKRELELLTQRTREEGGMFEGVSDSFPELLREYARLKPEVDAKEAQLNELKENIRTLEEQALREYSDFFGVADDFADRMVQFRTDRASQGRYEKEILEAWEGVSILEERLSGIDASMFSSHPQFADLPENIETTIAVILRDTSKRAQLREELNALELQGLPGLAPSEEQQKKGLMGRIRRNTSRMAEDNTNRGRIELLRKALFDLDYAIDQARELLGPLSGREDLEQVQVELGGFTKLLRERAQLAGQVEAAQTHLAKLQQQNEELGERLKRQKDQFDASNDAELEARLPRFKEYQSLMARLNSTRKVLKSHVTPGELERSQKRLAELASSLGTFAERFAGSSPQYEDSAAELIDGFRIYKRRKQEAQRLKARLSNMQSEREIAALRQEAQETVRRERDKLGLSEDLGLTSVLEEWREFERLQAKVEAEEGIIRSHEGETVDMPEGSVSRLAWMRERVDELSEALGDLVEATDLDTMLEDVSVALSLTSRVRQIDEMLANHVPREVLEEQREALLAERAAGLLALGLPADANPDLDELEPAWARFTRLQERLLEAQQAHDLLLEWEGDTTAADRMKSRLDELARGLGQFTRLTDLDLCLRQYQEYLSLEAEGKTLEQGLAAIPTDAELDEAQFQVDLAMETERESLGVLPDESVEQVLAHYKTYRLVAGELRTETAVRTRLLSTVSVGDRSASTTEATLSELERLLEDLRASLGGFDEAGEDADEVISQFREAHALKREIEGVQQAVKAIRTPSELEQDLAAVRTPVAALENRLKPAGDLQDLDGMRARFRIFEDLQQDISSAKRGLAEHPTLEALDKTLEVLDGELVQTGERVKSLLEGRAVLARYYEKFAHRLDELRPTVTHNLSRLKENLSVLNLALEKTRNTYRQHVQPSSGSRGNLAVLREGIARREAELARLTSRRDGLLVAVERLESVVQDTQDNLVGGLQIRAQDILGALTAGRYTEVVLEGRSLEPMVKTRTGHALRGEAITGGLRDQLFFALRAAMAQEMAGNVRLPYLLDDPFVQFDDTRLAYARTYLTGLSERTQVVLFTHDDRCKSWGQVVVDLRGTQAEPAPAALPAVPEPEEAKDESGDVAEIPSPVS